MKPIFKGTLDRCNSYIAPPMQRKGTSGLARVKLTSRACFLLRIRGNSSGVVLFPFRVSVQTFSFVLNPVCTSSEVCVTEFVHPASTNAANKTGRAICCLHVTATLPALHRHDARKTASVVQSARIGPTVTLPPAMPVSPPHRTARSGLCR